MIRLITSLETTSPGSALDDVPFSRTLIIKLAPGYAWRGVQESTRLMAMLTDPMTAMETITPKAACDTASNQTPTRTGS